MLDIYEMKVFLAAAETGSFSEAGRRLQLSQPAVSMQIRALEKNLGVELFCRAGRHICLSEIGQALVPMARDLVNHAEQVQESITALNGEVIGLLKIAANSTAARYIFPRLIARFIEKYPSVQVICQDGKRKSSIQMVLDGDAHIGVSNRHEPSKDLEYRPFTADPIVLIVPPDHDWALYKTITPDELPNSKFIRHELNSDTQQIVMESLAQYGISIHDLPAVMVLCDTEAICSAVAEGIAPAFVSRRAAAQDIEAGRVVELPVKGLEICQELYLARLTNRAPSSVQRVFWEFVYSPRNQDILGC